MESFSENIRLLIELMNEAQDKLVNFYALCFEKFTDNRDIWSGILEDKMKHSGYFKKMLINLNEHPAEFKIRRPYSPEAARAIISAIEHSISQINEKAVPEKQALFMAKDIEDLLISSRYREAIESSDSEYVSLSDEILTEELSHKRIIINTIESLGGAA